MRFQFSSRKAVIGLKEMFDKTLSHIAYCINRANFIKPSVITFDVTDRCSLRCRTCSKWSSQIERKELDASAWKEIIYSLKRWLGNYRVCLSGGEIFLRKDIFDIISFARKQNIYVTAVSSGDRIAPVTADRIRASELNGISITLNGVTPSTHDFTRGVEGSHTRALSAISLLNKANKNMFVCIITVLMGHNQHEVIDLIKFTRENHLNGIGFQALHDTTSFSPFDSNHHFYKENTWYVNNPLWPQDIGSMQAIIDEIIEYKKKGYPIGNSIRYLLWMKRYFQNPRETLKIQCMVGLNNFSIDPYGETRLCFNMDSIGNIMSQKPEQLWNSRKAVQQRKAIKTCNNTCRILGCNFDDK